MSDEIDTFEEFEPFGDTVVACADLVGRSGAAGFELGWTGDDKDPRWYCHAQYQGTRVMAQGHKTPTGAAMELAERLLRGARCRCRRTVALSDPAAERCRWRLVGRRWEPGCDVPSVRIDTGRGDLAALRRALGVE